MVAWFNLIALLHFVESLAALSIDRINCFKFLVIPLALALVRLFNHPLELADQLDFHYLGFNAGY